MEEWPFQPPNLKNITYILYLFYNTSKEGAANLPCLSFKPDSDISVTGSDWRAHKYLSMRIEWHYLHMSGPDLSQSLSGGFSSVIN